MKHKESILQRAARSRVESAGKPASNLTYTTMQLVMAEASRRARRRRRQMVWLGAASWIAGIILCVTVIAITCGATLLSDFHGVWQTISDPQMWHTPGGMASVMLGCGGLVVMLASGFIGALYEKLMIRALSRDYSRN
ncbi:MAG: hypothetical protein J6C91_02675 [Muribaculaceae bacterium]|nr:hypothetical protein [Muribaculaceae bacterium]